MTTSAKHDHYEEIVEQQQRVKDALSAYTTAKEVAAAKKKRWESEVAELHSVLDGPAEDDEERPLLKDAKCNDTRKDWRKWDANALQEWGIESDVFEKLSASELKIDNLLQLRDAIATGLHWWRKVKGIGNVTGFAIEKAFLNLLEDNDKKALSELNKERTAKHAKAEPKKDAKPNKKAAKKPPAKSAKKAAKKTTKATPKKKPFKALKKKSSTAKSSQ